MDAAAHASHAAKGRRDRPRPRAAWPAACVTALLPAALAWSPLLLAPPPSLAGPDGLLDLGVGDVILQRDPAGCSLAVLAMLLRARGSRTGEETLTARWGGSPPAGGLTLAEVADLAGAAGLPGTWVRALPSDLATLPVPFAAELASPGPGRPGHLVLVRRLGPHGLLIADPERGLVAWPEDRFLAAWSGRAFLPDPPEPS